MITYIGNGELKVDPLPIIDTFLKIEMPYRYCDRLILPSQPPGVEDVTEKMRFGQYAILSSRN